MCSLSLAEEQPSNALPADMASSIFSSSDNAEAIDPTSVI